MRYTTKLYNTKTTSVIIPEFFAESGDRREMENVQRMNGFYDELRSSIFGFTGSESFPEGGKYFAKANISEDGERLSVKVTMRLRQNGKTLSQRSLTHIWQDGVVVEKLTN